MSPSRFMATASRRATSFTPATSRAASTRRCGRITRTAPTTSRRRRKRASKNSWPCSQKSRESASFRATKTLARATSTSRCSRTAAPAARSAGHRRRASKKACGGHTNIFADETAASPAVLAMPSFYLPMYRKYVSRISLRVSAAGQRSWTAPLRMAAARWS